METESQPSGPSWLTRAIFGKDPRATLVRVFVWAAILFVTFKFLLMPVRIVGLSMHPTYMEGKIRFINRAAYKWAEPKRGDVVALRREGDNFLLLKRIVGLPGEKVMLRNGHIYINGELLEEPYANLVGSTFNDGPITLKEDYYFVIGDNRKVSAFNPEHRRKIIGKAVF